MDAQSFSPFLRLALEIRLAIWSYAMTPGVVYIKPVGNPRIQNPRKQENPSLLRVCRESRTAALRKYELASDIDKTYVNFDLDTIYIDYTDSYDLESFPLYASENEARFQYLAIDMHWINFLGLDLLINKVSRCPSLRKITFVVQSQAINNEGANLSTTAEKSSEAYLIEMNTLFISTQLYKLISSTWVCLVQKYFPNKDRWPEISLITRPSVFIKNKVHREEVNLKDDSKFLKLMSNVLADRIETLQTLEG